MQTLRQPRYAALTALMLLVALICVAAGTWQIARFDNKVHENDDLTGNAHVAAVPVDALLPVVGGRGPSADAVRYRTVTATGTYDQRQQGLVRLRSVNDDQGFYVLTPLVTKHATLLVVRGFVSQRSNGAAPASVAAAPSGQVTVRARLQTGESRTDLSDGIPAGQLWSINPTDQAARLGTPVYDGYAQLLSRQPGTAGLTAIPAPDLSNPAGGAVEPQHFAYIIQWYLFAVLALAAPVAMSRAERREQAASDGRGPDVTPTQEELRVAKLADRYGRPVHR